jgi:hypothetical protein
MNPEWGLAMASKDETYCQYCGDPMDAGSEFVFLVEAQVYNEEVAPLLLVQQSPDYHGEPLRVCQQCRASIEQNRLDLLQRAAEEEASSRRWRKVLAIVGVFVLLAVLALIIADLRS